MTCRSARTRGGSLKGRKRSAAILWTGTPRASGFGGGRAARNGREARSHAAFRSETGDGLASMVRRSPPPASRWSRRPRDVGRAREKPRANPRFQLDHWRPSRPRPIFITPPSIRTRLCWRCSALSGHVATLRRRLPRFWRPRKRRASKFAAESAMIDDILGFRDGARDRPIERQQCCGFRRP